MTVYCGIGDGLEFMVDEKGHLYIKRINDPETIALVATTKQEADFFIESVEYAIAALKIHMK